MFSILSDIEKRADKISKNVVLGFFSIILSQYILVTYGTYIAFSWDIMEPITCAMTLGDAICAYFFWIWSKKPYSIAGLREFFFERKKKKLIKKYKLDFQNFVKNQEAIAIIKERLDEL